MKRVLASLAVPLLALAPWIACGGSTDAFQEAGTSDTAERRESGPGPLDGGALGDIFLVSDVMDSRPTRGCSGDLRSVVNAKGAVLLNCPPSEGCAAGACVPACHAAAANKGTLGCDFVVATPSFYPLVAPSCFAVFLANSWTQPIAIDVSRGGVSFGPLWFGFTPVAGLPPSDWPKIPATGLPPGQVGILFLSLGGGEVYNACPIGPPVDTYAGSSVYTGNAAATGIGQAFHIVTSLPVIAYDVMPFGGGSSVGGFGESAELLLPTTAWETNYYGIVPRRGDADAAVGPQWGQVVAMQDGTTVTVLPNVALPAGPGVPSAPPGVTTSFSLNAGEFIQWQDSTEMSSTILSSNHPVGFTGGSGFGCYSSATSGSHVGSIGQCEPEHQQIPPIFALGHEYVAAPYTTRMASLTPESILYRIVGTVDGTKLTYDPAIVAGAPQALKAGEVVDLETTGAFRVTSQDADHPLYVAQFMSRCHVTGGSRAGCGGSSSTCCLGNSQFVNVLPPAQFLQSYTFFTDTTFATTNLVITRVKGPSGFEDVTLDCAGVLAGWQPVGTSGQYEITNIDLIRSNVPNGTCNNGAHSATSAGRFGLTVWGLDSGVSYAYPAGGNVAAINSVVVPATPK